MQKTLLFILLMSLSLTSYSQEVLTCNQLQVGYTDHASCHFLELFNSALEKAEKNNKTEVRIIRKFDICDNTVRNIQILSSDNKVLTQANSYKIIKYVDSFEGHMFVKIEDIAE